MRALIDLQYDRPGTAVHGTYRRFLEWPEPPAEPVMWEHYDPNWRQFVGTTFAVIVEDFADRLGPELVGAIEASILLACEGEPEGRISPSYSNPRSCAPGSTPGPAGVSTGRSWWSAARVRAADRRGLRPVRCVRRVQLADLLRHRPLRAPALAGDPARRLLLDAGRASRDRALAATGAFFNANVRSFGGPFTRSYHPDATRSVTLFSLWIWALLGRELAPLPPIDTEPVDHGHDLMAGPLFARLAGEPRGDDLSEFRAFGGLTASSRSSRVTGT